MAPPTDPDRAPLSAQLERLGDDLEQLLPRLLSWVDRAGPLLETYFDTTVALEEDDLHPAWVHELPEAARTMGLALGLAAAIEDAVARGDPSMRGWAYVEHLLGGDHAASLRTRAVPRTRAVLHEAPRSRPAGDPERGEAVVEDRVGALEARYARMQAMVESLALALGAVGAAAAEQMVEAGHVDLAVAAEPRRRDGSEAA